MKKKLSTYQILKKAHNLIRRNKKWAKPESLTPMDFESRLDATVGRLVTNAGFHAVLLSLVRVLEEKSERHEGAAQKDILDAAAKVSRLAKKFGGDRS